MKYFSIRVKKKIKNFNETINVDPDKSISIRFFLLASNAYGVSKGYNILESEDVKATISVLKKLGTKIKKKNSCYYVYGNGLHGYKIKKNLILNFENSGTLGRLLPSFLMHYPKKIKLIGDASLSKRDFFRIIEPLEKIGAEFTPRKKFNLPFYIKGSEVPLPINYEEKRGSAQCKSSVLFAALNCPGITSIKALKSRDHSEIILKMIGANIKINKKKKYDQIYLSGQKEFKAFDLYVPGDISSASFLIVLTVLMNNSKLKIKNVNLNPTRTGILTILKKMNANIYVLNKKYKYGELVGDIIAKTSKNIKPINCPKSIVPFAIDEFPIIFLVAARANGVSTFSNLRELNLKESKRLNLMNEILNKIGIKTKITDNSIKIWGNPKLQLKNEFNINTMYDHRIAMVSVVAGLVFGGNFKISDGNSILTSFPNFLKKIKSLGGKYEIK